MGVPGKVRFPHFQIYKLKTLLCVHDGSLMVFHCKRHRFRMGVEVRGPGQEGVEEGDQVAGVNTPVILR